MATSLLKKATLPEGRSGRYTVERFTVSDTDMWRYNLRNAERGTPDLNIEAGTYTRLMRRPAIVSLQGERPVVVMSDTPSELRDHVKAAEFAKGRCLIHGLGLGIIAKAMLDKPEVTHVTVVEQSPDVIKLVAEHYLSDPQNEGRLEIIMGDALSWKPPRGAHWDVVWHDIWDSISADNWPSMTKLHRRFGRRSDWQGSWRKEHVKQLVQDDKNLMADAEKLRAFMAAIRR